MMKIGERILHYRRGSIAAEIPVRIFAPFVEKPGVCGGRYEIEWPDEQRAVIAYGVDGVQALLVAMQMIGAEIYTSNYHKAGELRWDEASAGYGFPVAPTLRDLLRGSDQNFV